MWHDEDTLPTKKLTFAAHICEKILSGMQNNNQGINQLMNE
jgi:hypothetical protein